MRPDDDADRDRVRGRSKHWKSRGHILFCPTWHRFSKHMETLECKVVHPHIWVLENLSKNLQVLGDFGLLTVVCASFSSISPTHCKHRNVIHFRQMSKLWSPGRDRKGKGAQKGQASNAGRRACLGACLEGLPRPFGIILGLKSPDSREPSLSPSGWFPQSKQLCTSQKFLLHSSCSPMFHIPKTK